MVLSNKIYAPQNYVGGITGNCFIRNYNGITECICKHLEKYGFDNLWDYPLMEIDHIIENNLNVVLVDCSHYEGNVYVNEYRWFEVPEECINNFKEV
jgi:hypothetical protein